MTVDRYSHCFTKSQLQHIIDGYLGLRPYYIILIKILKKYTQKYEQLPDMHNKDKPHPIRIYSKDSLCTKNILDDFCDLESTKSIHEGLKLCELRSTYNSTSMRFFYLYPLETMVDLLTSQQFYAEVPKDIIVNNLLTTTNIQIIIQTLTIVSEDMSRKIKATLAGKQNKLHKNIQSQKAIGPGINCQKDTVRGVELPTVIEEIEEHGVIIQSAVDIGDEIIEEQSFKQSAINIEVIQLQPSEKNIKESIISKSQGEPILDQRMTKTQKSTSQKYMGIERDCYQTNCNYCQNYLFYLNEITNYNLSQQSLNSLSKESLRCLRLISQTIVHFTLYLIQANQVQIPNDIHVINRVLNSIGIVITEDIFASELNPKTKTKRKVESLLTNPKNLIEELQPYFWTVDLKNKNDAYYSIEELFRMVVYCPTTEEVAQQLRNYQTEIFQKQKSLIRSTEKDEKAKVLLKQQCSNMRLYQQQRLQIMTNSVNFKPIYKQLQFEEEKIVLPQTNPRSYNGYRPSTSSSGVVRRSGYLNTCSPFSITTKGPIKAGSPFCKEKKSVMSELAHTLSKMNNNKGKPINKMEQISNKTTDKKIKKVSTKKDRWHQSRVDTMFFNENQLQTMSATLKKNVINNQIFSKGKLLQTDQSSDFIRVNATQPNEEVELSDPQFRRMMCNAYFRNKNTNNGENFALIAPNPNSSYCPSFSVANNSAVQKSNLKKNNPYSNSLNQLMGRKQQLEQIQCMEKKEKEAFNKQLLNGQSVKDQIYEEMRMGAAKVYQNLNSAKGSSESHLHSLCDNFLLTEPAKYEDSDTKWPYKHRNKQTSVIIQNRVKFNQSGLIRNQKYSKSIKNELINHRNSYLLATEKQNKNKFHKNPIHKGKNSCLITEGNVKEMYQQELKRVLQSG